MSFIAAFRACFIGAAIAAVAFPAAAVSSFAGSAHHFVRILNGERWPKNFRPYCANASPKPSSPCPFNDRLPENPAELYPNSAAIVASMFGSNDHVVLPGDFSLSGDVSHPVYLARASDPFVTVTCTRYCTLPLARFRIPGNARPAGGSDHHLGIIEPDGTEWDMWNSTYAGGPRATAGALVRTSIFGSGAVPGGGATSGSALAAGMIRFDELARGAIPHALFAVTSCVKSERVYPAGSNAMVCSNNVADAPPVGARLQLALTGRQIDSLRALPWEKAILHAMHDYGVYVLDTNGASSAPGPIWLMWEAVDQFAAYGRPYPGGSFPGLVTGNWNPGGLDWAQSLRVVSPCYAEETCAR